MCVWILLFVFDCLFVVNALSSFGGYDFAFVLVNVGRLQYL